MTICQRIRGSVIHVVVRHWPRNYGTPSVKFNNRLPGFEHVTHCVNSTSLNCSRCETDGDSCYCKPEVPPVALLSLS